MNLICYFKGHVIVPGLYEDSEIIRVQICDRCKRGFGKSIYKPFQTCYPPHSTPEQIRSWERYYNDKMNHARNNLEIL